MSRREAILEKVRSVPAIPASASQVVRLLGDPDFVMEDVIRLIEHDPVSTANILKLANSAYFSRGAPVLSVRDAVVRLGAQRVGQLLMVASVGSMADQPLAGYDLAPGELWRHSVAVAIGTELLAKHTRLQPPDYAFTAGLLHDLGKIVLDVFIQADAEPIKGLAFVENLTFEMAERQILGADHSEVGAVLLDSWNIPDGLCQVVRWHHEPGRAPETSMATDLVHAADHAAIEAGIGVGIDGPSYRVSAEALDRLRLGPGAIGAVSGELGDAVKAIEELFRMA